jgi:hypothetical protein
VPFAAPAGAWPGDGYYYAPYPPAIAMMPPPPYLPAPYYAPQNYYAAPIPSYGPRQYGYAPPAPSNYAGPGYAGPGYFGPEPLSVPPRPSSCGKYRYWNGDYCADARSERPYVGPKW